MARLLTHLVGLAFSSWALCNALATGGGRSQILEGRQLESNGLPGVDNFLRRAYHSGSGDRSIEGSAPDKLRLLFLTITSTLTEEKSASPTTGSPSIFQVSHDLTVQASANTLITGQ